MQVLQSYLLAHLDLQTMYNVIYLDMIRFKNIETATISVSDPYQETIDMDPGSVKN